MAHAAERRADVRGHEDLLVPEANNQERNCSLCDCSLSAKITFVSLAIIAAVVFFIFFTPVIAIVATVAVLTGAILLRLFFCCCCCCDENARQAREIDARRVIGPIRGVDARLPEAAYIAHPHHAHLPNARPVVHHHRPAAIAPGPRIAMASGHAPVLGRNVPVGGAGRGVSGRPGISGNSGVSGGPEVRQPIPPQFPGSNTAIAPGPKIAMAGGHAPVLGRNVPVGGAGRGVSGRPGISGNPGVSGGSEVRQPIPPQIPRPVPGDRVRVNQSSLSGGV